MARTVAGNSSEPTAAENTAAAVNATAPSTSSVVLPRPAPISSAQTPVSTAHCAHSARRSRSSDSGSVRWTCQTNAITAGPTSSVSRWLPIDTAPM
jgi:hypothetical protein